MTSADTPNVLLFGAGSVGAVYLYLLSKVASVTAVCRSNYDVVQKTGFIINSSIFGQNIHFQPKVVRSCAEAVSASSKPFDFILVCSKAIPGIIPPLITPAVTPGHTAIVLIQNGIGIEQEYVDAFPTNPIVSCVLYLPATQRPAGVIKHGELELLQIGAYPSSAPAAHAKSFQELITAAGGTAKFYEDMQSKRWSKLLINASWNPVCALTHCTDAEFLVASPGATDFIFSIMMEVVQLAKAYGSTLSQHDAELQLERATARVKNGNGVEPSMLQDVRLQRKTEVEAIVGNAVRMAKAKAIQCPRLESLYFLLKALDSQLGKE